MTCLVQPRNPNNGAAAAWRAARRCALAAGLFLVSGICVPPVVAQPNRLHAAFDAAIIASDAPHNRRAHRPITSRPQRLAPVADSSWQPKGMQRSGQLRWGVRLAQAELPQAESPITVVPPTADALPPPMVQGTLPLAGSAPSDNVQLSQDENGLITLIVRDASLSQVLALLAQTQGLNIVAANDIDALISITIRGVPVEEALTAILSVANYTWIQRDNIILVTSLADPSMAADVQDRQIQVFELDFVSAQVVAEAVANFLSPVGKVSLSASDPADSRRTRELVVVEDLPGSLARIAAYIEQVDCPPRQVLIEAHILQVNLDDTNRQGVNLNALTSISNSDLTLKTVGLANAAAPQAFLATLDGGDVGGVIELLQTTTDSKTLGSPKLLVLNEQEARMQVGDQLGFKVTTTTETSTMETVQFLDVGVVLTIRPRITRDGHVLLNVKPEVSTGEVNPDTGLPEESTTELETDIMLEDGQGMVIGGLIKETDSVTQSKIPYLGDIKGLGWFFRRSEVTKERVEIIVALVPRIQPYDAHWQAYEQGELVKAGVPLLHGPLARTYRPWDTVLPDGKRVYRPLIPRMRRHHQPAFGYEQGSGYIVPPHPLPEQNFYGDCETEFQTPADIREQLPLLSDEAMPLSAPSAGGRRGR